MKTSRVSGCFKCHWAKDDDSPRKARPAGLWQRCIHCSRNPKKVKVDNHETEAQYRLKSLREDTFI